MDTMSDHDAAREEFLEHYGVKGMKWGVRKRPEPNLKRTLTNRAKRLELKKRLDDAELKKAVERLRLEREYVNINKDLSNDSHAKTFISRYGGQAVSIAIAAVVSKVVQEELKKKYS
jgi:hypothetical protein